MANKLRTRTPIRSEWKSLHKNESALSPSDYEIARRKREENRSTIVSLFRGRDTTLSVVGTENSMSFFSLVIGAEITAKPATRRNESNQHVDGD